MSDVFISYAREDETRARELASALAANGLDVRWDHTLAAGDKFDEKLPEWIDAAATVVVLWSRHSFNSTWVKFEANRGLDQDKLCPVSFDDHTFIPAPFPQLHTEDFTSWNGDENAECVKELVRAINTKLDIVRDDGAPSVKPDATKDTAAASSRKSIKIVASALVLVVLGGVALGWQWYSSNDPCSPAVRESFSAQLDELEQLATSADAAAVSIQVRNEADGTIIESGKIMIGDRFVFDVESPTSGYLILVNVDSNSDVTQIYPNKFVTTRERWRITPDQKISVPGPGYGFSFRAQEPVGSGLLVALVAPLTFPVDALIGERERLARGFAPEANAPSYLDELVEQIENHTTDGNSDQWSYSARQFCFVNR